MKKSIEKKGGVLSKKTQPPRFRKEPVTIYSVLFVLLVITVYGIGLLFQDQTDFSGAWNNFFRYCSIMFFQPGLSNHITFGDFLSALLFSLALALETTLIGIVVAFFLALAAAENISHSVLSRIVRAVTAVVRAVPTIIWVLVFSVTVNIGTDAAVLGMSFHSVAYLVKGFSESFEQINRDTIDALKSCGAGFFSIIAQAVIPVSAASIISWSFFRFEINFINAVAIGAAAGAGGIGYHLFMAGSLYFNVNEVGFLTYAIFLTALCLEMLSRHLRKKYRVR